jgi:formamidopyrimidine-DNA glycosylase
MPELPEVQTTVNGLNEVLAGRSIAVVWTSYKSDFHAGKENIKNPEYFKKFKKEVVGRSFESAKRKGKNILINLSGGRTILIHMKMTGHLLYGRYAYDKKTDTWKAVKDEALRDPFNQHIRLVFSLDNGMHLAFSDLRKFANVAVYPSDETHARKDLSNIGQDPLDPGFTLKEFRKLVSKRPNGKIKQTLMDQSLVAGIGNIYSDEILCESSIHPEERVSNLDDADFKKMFAAAKELLRKGIRFGGDSDSDYRNIRGERGAFQKQHKAYRRTGKPCLLPGCPGIIQRKVVGGRSAHFCDTHQRLRTNRA